MSYQSLLTITEAAAATGVSLEEPFQAPPRAAAAALAALGAYRSTT